MDSAATPWDCTKDGVTEPCGVTAARGSSQGSGSNLGLGATEAKDSSDAAAPADDSPEFYEGTLEDGLDNPPRSADREGTVYPDGETFLASLEVPLG